MMLTSKNIVRILIPPGAMPLLKTNAESACLGGKSHIREDEDRQEELFNDQLNGQIGHFAGSLWLCGDGRLYYQQRYLANINPHLGDNGSDVLGANIDFKGSLMRGSPDPLDYSLLVRPGEMHPDWVYVQVMIEPDQAAANIIGWASTDMFPAEPSTDSRWKGAFRIPGRELRPVPPFAWWRPLRKTA